VPLGPRTLLIVIADVEGKGVASALMMANLQASLHTLAAHGHTLVDIIKSVNNLIFSDTREKKLLSMFVGVLDHRQRSLHYINAGHVPPVVIRPGGGIVELSEGGMVVGAFPDPSYTRGYIQLREDDIVAGYTDGITEAMDAHGNQYGLENLVNAVRRNCSRPAEQIVHTVLAEVDRLSRGTPHDDDRVMLILKVL
jgi:phosphoserine phosphatase RsbU/P